MVRLTTNTSSGGEGSFPTQRQDTQPVSREPTPDSGPPGSLPPQGGAAVLEQPDGTATLVLLAPTSRPGSQVNPAAASCVRGDEGHLTYQALTVGPDDLCLQASIAQADAILQQRLGSRCTLPPPHVTTLPGMTLPEYSLASLPTEDLQPPSTGSSSGGRVAQQQGYQQQPTSQGQSGGESDWLQHMREADEALRAAIERRDVVRSIQARQPGSSEAATT